MRRRDDESKLEKGHILKKGMGSSGYTWACKEWFGQRVRVRVSENKVGKISQPHCGGSS